MGVLYGNINSDGSTKSGSGEFSSRKAGNGEYVVTFRPKFHGVPSVIATQNYPGWSDFGSSGGSTKDNCTIVAVSYGEVKIKTGDGDGKATDRNFCFIAVGA